MKLTEVKAIAKKRHEYLKKLGRDVKLSDMYESLAWEAGFKDWNVYSAYLKALPTLDQLKESHPRMQPLTNILDRLGWKLAPKTYNHFTPHSWYHLDDLYSGLYIRHPEIVVSDPVICTFFETWEPEAKAPDDILNQHLKLLNLCGKAKGVWFPTYKTDAELPPSETTGEHLYFFKGCTDESLLQLIYDEGPDKLRDLAQITLEEDVKTEYLIANDMDDEKYTKKFLGAEDAKDWIINHLDVSKTWTVKAPWERD